jgi:hypothetical protein
LAGQARAKTTFLQLLVEASAGQMPVVVLDPKGSPALAETVRAHGGEPTSKSGKTPCENVTEALVETV